MAPALIWSRRIVRMTSIILAAIMSTCCHSMMPIVVRPPTLPTPTAAAFSELRVDDVVQVTLLNASVAEFRVGGVHADALVAMDGRQFLYEDITRVEKRHIAAGQTTIVSVLIFAGLFVLAGVTTVGW